jgi:hypothetical protein
MIIRIIHWALILFMLIVPFIGSEYYLTIHLIILPFIVLHWLTNQSVCALTEFEKFVSGKENDSETFFGQIMEPIYKFHKQENENLFLYTLMAALFTITLIKLQRLGFAQLKGDFARFFQSSSYVSDSIIVESASDSLSESAASISASR